MVRLLSLIAVAGILSGCALSPPDHALNFDCEPLGAHLHDYAPDGFSETGAFNPDAKWTGTESARDRLDPMEQAMIGAPAAAGTGTEALVPRTAPVTAPSNVLLLSGGGQWGAFGAGLLSQLQQQGDLPEFTAVNGISTGAMQALYVAAGRPEDYLALSDVYQLSADHYVRHNGGLSPLWRGSRATFAPLRSLLESRLCPAGTDAPCPLIDAIRQSPRNLFIGMVQAQSGRFAYVDVRGLLVAIDGDSRLSQRAKRTVAQQCVTAVAMGSSSIPVMLQRVRIHYVDHDGSQRHDIFYDGGVRYSVFDATIAAYAQNASRRRLANAVAADSAAAVEVAPVNLYIVRNGPLRPFADDHINNSGSILDAAMRGYALMVNQSEIMSIRAMRLYNRTGAIRYVTADGYTGNADCVEHAGTSRKHQLQFYQPFMQCLASHGADIARAGGWQQLDAPATP